MSVDHPRHRRGRDVGARLPAAALLALLAFAPGYAVAQTDSPGAPPTPEPAPEPATQAAPAPSAPAQQSAQVEFWINRSLPVRASASVYVAPDEAAEMHGRLAPGGEVMVLATIVGGDWLQVRLPDNSVGYVKAAAIALAPASAAAEPPATPPAGTPAPPAAEPTANPASADAAAAPPPADAAPLNGRPLVRDTATLVIDGRAVLLAGVEGVVGDAVVKIQDHIAQNGNAVSCAPAAELPGYFTCHLDDGTDLAKLLLVNGLARIAAGAPDDYMVNQDAAAQQSKGIWASPDTCAAWTITPTVATVAFTDPADEGLYFVDREPFVVLQDQPVPIMFNVAVGGWGYYDGGAWVAAPPRWGRHLDYVYPRGAGLRDVALRTQALHTEAFHAVAMHEVVRHESAFRQQAALAERMHLPQVAPPNVRPVAMRQQISRPEAQHQLRTEPQTARIPGAAPGALRPGAETPHPSPGIHPPVASAGVRPAMPVPAIRPAMPMPILHQQVPAFHPPATAVRAPAPKPACKTSHCS